MKNSKRRKILTLVKETEHIDSDIQDVYVQIPLCVCVYVYMHVGGGVLYLTQILDLSHTSHLCIGLVCTEIKTEIWISYSNLIRSDNVWPQQRCLPMALLSELSFRTFWTTLLCVCILIYTHTHCHFMTEVSHLLKLAKSSCERAYGSSGQFNFCKPCCRCDN